MLKRIGSLVLVALLIVAVSAGIMPSYSVKAGTETYNHIIPFTITDTGGVARTNLPVIITYDVNGRLVAQGLTNATATDTYVDSSGAGNSPVGSGTAYDYLMATSNITVIIPSLPAYGSYTVNLYTGYSPLQTAFPVIVAPGGSFTTPSDISDDMQLGDNFSSEFNGHVDTDYTAPTYEDFTTYTEEDDNGKLTVTATRATGADVDRDEDVWLYKDKGADYFDDLYVEFEIYVAETSVDGSCGGIAISNTVATIVGFATTDVSLTGRRAAAGGVFDFILARGNDVAVDSYAGVTNTLYYCRFERDAGNDTVTLKIYSDADRELLLDTLTVAGFGTEKWQYAFGFVNRNTTTAGKNWDGYTQNLDITFTGVKRLVYKAASFKTYISGTETITSTIYGEASVSATGVESDNYTVTTTMIKQGSWWNEDWAFRKQLTFDNSASSENLVNIPVAVSVNSTNLDWTQIQADGDDIRFIDANDSTELDFFWESWESGNSTAIALVEVPQIDSGSTTDHIFMYWGNPDAANNEDMNGVFTADVKLATTYKGSSNIEVKDATSYGNDGDFLGVGQPNWARLDSSLQTLGFVPNAFINVPDSVDFNMGTGNFTIEAWIYKGDITGVRRRIATYEVLPAATQYFLSTNGRIAELTTYNAGYGVQAQTGTILSVNTWYHVVGVRSVAANTTATGYVYVTGAVQATDTHTPALNLDTANDFEIGRTPENAEYWNGKIILFRLYNEALSAEEVEAHYLSEKHLFGYANDFITFEDTEYNIFAIYIDNVLKDYTSANITVPNNGNDWYFNQNDVMPWIDYYRHTIDDTLITRYEPNALISGTTLPDRESAGNDATITWGTNTNITVTGGSIMDSNSATSVGVTSFMFQGELIHIGTYTTVYLAFEYGLNTNYGYSTSETSATGGQTHSVTLTGLTPNTTYHYRAVARSGIVYSYGEDITVTTSYSTASQGSTTPLIITTGVFSGYQETGDLLFCAEIILTYPPYYPTKAPYRYFQMQLLDTNGTTILGATPIMQWGDRPASIYFNATVSGNLTYQSAYIISVENISSENITLDVTETLTPSDWRGDDLTELDEWCRGVAWSMMNTDGTLLTDPYLKAVMEYGTIITGAAGGYFSKGTPNIQQIRPNLFATGQYSDVTATLTSDIGYNVGDTLTERVGATIVADATTVGAIFNMTGANTLLLMIALTVFGFIIFVVSQTRGFGALGALCLSLPVIGAGMYLEIMEVALITIVVILLVFFAIRQFIFKTM